jgi:hypothetical protein
MSNVHSLLAERLQKKAPSIKMAVMAEQTVNGALSSFSGIFSGGQLAESEKALLESLLTTYSLDTSTLSDDLNLLTSITSEVKAINNQAALLHGERIKKVQSLLKNYKEGAFSAWLLATYGNRQTPYNFLQYFEFYETVPKSLHIQLEMMPRQAVYSLASREAPFVKKVEFVENYKGEKKSELLQKIRQEFPLAIRDKRRQNLVEIALQKLKQLYMDLSSQDFTPSPEEASMLYTLLAQIKKAISQTTQGS